MGFPEGAHTELLAFDGTGLAVKGIGQRPVHTARKHGCCCFLFQMPLSASTARQHDAVIFFCCRRSAYEPSASPPWTVLSGCLAEPATSSTCGLRDSSCM